MVSQLLGAWGTDGGDTGCRQLSDKMRRAWVNRGLLADVNWDRTDYSQASNRKIMLKNGGIEWLELT